MSAVTDQIIDDYAAGPLTARVAVRALVAARICELWPWPDPAPLDISQWLTPEQLNALEA